MSIQNLMEDIVANVVEEVMKKDKDLEKIKVNRDDIVAYVLNRIPPKYITSERGILHGKIQAHYETQQKTDMLFSVYEAIDVIKKRRSTELHSAESTAAAEEYRLSHIVGEVLEETTLSMIPNVEVTLLFKGKPAKMIDDNWKNPYTTNKATKGYYHFWPIFSKGDMGKSAHVPFTLEFSHPKFEDKKVDIEIETISKPNMAKTHTTAIVLLQAKVGVDLDFLYK
ncbi:MAG: hypothetical protein CVV44_17730 [Spirochaetae bacterium HGW-Spirochaetae-1]|jgi:competence protein ComFB|nr:MAG: hypothetical protein CVV44_17730 [Spirochaetae bacterium HGW-Spirochaetae-1]